MCEPPPLLQESPLRPEPVVPALRVAPQPLGQRVRPREDLALYGGSVDLGSINVGNSTPSMVNMGQACDRHGDEIEILGQFSMSVCLSLNP